mgnify:CR=1 FL=1
MKHSRNIPIICLLLLALLPETWAQSNGIFPTVTWNGRYHILGPGGEVGVLRNVHLDFDSLTIEEVKVVPNDWYEPWRKERFRFGFIRHPQWLRLDLTDTIDRKLILELNNPYLSEVRLFQVCEDDNSKILGSDHPFRGRRHWNLQDTIRLSAGDTVRVFLQIPYNRSQTDFRLLLWDAQERLAATRQEMLFLLVFFCLIFVYLLTLGIAIFLTRFRYYWFYFLYVLLVSGYIFADMGLGYENLWPGSPYLQQVSLPVLANAYLIAGILFVLAHFRTRTGYPFHDQALRTVIWIAGGLMVMALFLPAAPPHFAHLFSYFSSVIYIITCLLFFWLAGTALVRKDRHFPGWLMVAFLTHGLTVIYSGLESFGLVPTLSLAQALAENGWRYTFHTPLILLLGLIVEIGIVLAIGVKRFKNLVAESEINAKALAAQRQQNLNALAMGMEAEQRRLAQELHDGLGGSISVAKFKIEALREKNGQDPATSAALDEAARALGSLHHELREIAHNLMPRHLHKHGLLTAVEQLIHRMEHSDRSLKIHFFSNADLDNISELARTYLFRIVQEMLNNLFKHAQANEAWFQFIRHDGNLLLTLEDNGRGFDLSQAKNKGGIGLSNIRYRVEDALGGRFEVDSTPGKGTLLSIEIPLKSLTGGKEHLFPKEKVSERKRLGSKKK